jgi:hypothetical protein
MQKSMPRSEADESNVKRRQRIWPGMPTRGSRLVESLFVLFPVWLFIVIVLLGMLIGLFRSFVS